MNDYCITSKDREILRALAQELRSDAESPLQDEKRKLWTKHNDLKTNQPLVFCDPENGWHEIITDDMLKCESQLARNWEWFLRRQLFTSRIMLDDVVIDAEFTVPYIVSNNGWGLRIEHIGGENNGAYHVKQAIQDYEEDFSKLHYPEYTVDYAASNRLLSLAQETFEPILTVRRYHAWWWSLGMTAQLIDLRGLEDFMYDLVDEPEWIHRFMDFLCTGTLKMIDRLEQEGLLCQNIGNRYVGSGGFGFTDQIAPVDEHKVTSMDMWGFVESQETVSISPEMYNEFIYPYHERIASRFALNCFACCEPYDLRWKYARNLPRLRRVSCSPWSNREKTEENLGMNYIASFKLNPSPLSQHNMDEDYVRQLLRDALKGATHCVPELIMKDCHTIGHNPQNPVRWVQMAREEIARIL
ncbi:MAG: hypothetical protein IJJ23_05525 [Clostridia bacterium]|nr:hypothetical protein [Clostridia bacterium]